MAIKLDESALSACKSNGTSKGQKPVYFGAVKPEHDDYKFLMELKVEVEKKGTRFQEYVINVLKTASGIESELPKDEKVKDEKSKAQ